MRGRVAALAGVVLTLGMAACASSPPVHFLTLHVVPHAAPGTTTDGHPALAVGRISLPPGLDRNELVRRTGADTMDVDETYRWAAPLDVLVQHTLAVDLAARLPDRLVVLPGEPDPPGPVDVVAVTFRTFAVDAGNHVQLGARWTWTTGQSKQALVTDDAEVSTPASSASGADVAEAMSAALAKLADAIAARLAGR